MGLFDMFKSKKQNNNSTPPSQNTIKPKGGFDNLPLYEHISGVDCFDIHSKRYNDLQIKIGDHLQVLFMPGAISNAIDAVVCFENKKLGYLPHNIGKWLRLFYSKNDNECIVENIILGDKNELFVKIKLPYKNIDKNLPLKTNLVGVTFDNRQNALNQINAFNEFVNLDGIILTKLDGTAKGGVVIAIEKDYHLPVAFVGVGEGVDDLEKFDYNDFIDNLF